MMSKIYRMGADLLIDCLVEQTESRWKLVLPFIPPLGLAGDVEEILHQKRFNPEFRLVITLLEIFPMSLEEYKARERVLSSLFQRIAERRYPLGMIVSATNHYMMQEESPHYEWDTFLDDVIIIDERQNHSYHAVYQGTEVTSLRVVLSESDFKDVESEAQSAYLSHEWVTRESGAVSVPMGSVHVPLGSIIQITLGPEPM